MKKNHTVFLVVFLALSISCSNNDSSDIPLTIEDKLTSKTWVYDRVDYDGFMNEDQQGTVYTQAEVSQNIDNYNESLTYKFDSDNTGIASIENQTSGFTWSISVDGDLLLDFPVSSRFGDVEYVFNVSETELLLDFSPTTNYVVFDFPNGDLVGVNDLKVYFN